MHIFEHQTRDGLALDNMGLWGQLPQYPCACSLGGAEEPCTVQQHKLSKGKTREAGAPEFKCVGAPIAFTFTFTTQKKVGP